MGFTAPSPRRPRCRAPWSALSSSLELALPRGAACKGAKEARRRREEGVEAAVTSHKSVEPAVPARAALSEQGAEAARPGAAAGAPGAAAGGASRGLWISSTYFAEGLPYAIAHKVAGE